MRDELLALIPEFAWVQDEDLRERCIRTWEVALERGGWTVADVANMPFTLLIPNCPASFADHVRAVTHTCAGVADTFEAIYGDRNRLDRDVLMAGALLHDVGKLLEYTRDANGQVVLSAQGRILRHPVSGTVLAAEQGLPDAVLHCIIGHSKEGDAVKRSKEAVIVHHADFTNFETLK